MLKLQTSCGIKSGKFKSQTKLGISSGVLPKSLPTKQNLFKRNVLKENQCSYCGEHSEDCLHALWLCHPALSVWQSEINFLHFYQKKFRSFVELASTVIEQAPSLKVALFSMITWCLWQRRNRIREKQPIWTLTEVALKAKELLNELLDVQQKPLGDLQPRSPVRWNPPSEGMYKANFDGSIFSELFLGGIGVVIRDAYGNVIAALSQKIPLPHSVDLVEALAASRAVSFARELRISKVEFEGDSKRVVTAINNQAPSKTYVWSCC